MNEKERKRLALAIAKAIQKILDAATSAEVKEAERKAIQAIRKTRKRI